MSKAESHNLNQRFVALLFNTRNRIRFAMDDRFKPLGITDATWRTLFFLRQDNGTSQKQLALTMGIEGPSLVR
ncbi:MAG: MarR family transcriptional regulator for hemolysin, partial [Candidatus Azotimanducaceae bacterium]